MERKKKELNHITCECGYNNKPYNVERYGTCTRCGKVLNKKAKFEYEMFCKLNLWRSWRRHDKKNI